MKKKAVSKILAGILAAAMALSMAACGDDAGEGSSTGSSTPESQNEDNSGSGDESKADSQGGEESQGGQEGNSGSAPMSITVALPGDPDVEKGKDLFDRLVADVNEYTNMNAEFKFLDSNTYFAQLGLRFAANDVDDVMIVNPDAAFWSAAVGGTYKVKVDTLDENGNPVMEDVLDKDGNPVKDDDGNVKQQVVQHEEERTIEGSETIFWDITDYVDDYDNLAMIPEATRAAASYNGRLYAIPRARNLARNGFGFRKDWCEKLNLAFWNKMEAGEDPTWQDFYDMLYAFTYNDPDGNGQNDTCGLYIDSWNDVWNIVMMWFGVPNEWGIDANGDLIHKTQTPEYKTALKEIRKLFEDGLVNYGVSGVDDFYTVKAGGARNGLQESKGGVGLQVLDDMRKVETTLESNGVGGATAEEPIFWLGGYVLTDSGNNEPHCLPTNGFSGMVAISKKNVKTEEQLRQVLQFLNDINDGECMNMLEYGWEGVTHEIDENGYVKVWMPKSETEERDQAKLDAAGVKTTTWNNGFNQIIAFHTAESNARPYTVAPPEGEVQKREQELLEIDIPFCVPNYGISFTTQTYKDHGKELDAIIKGSGVGTEDGQLASKSERGVQWNYILGEIDDAELDATLQSWWEAGGEQWTKEMHEAYHAAGH